jgi:predicted DNA-binding protein
MPRPALPDNEKKVVQVIRISPIARQRLESLPTSKKKLVIAAMRQAVELVINSMADSALHCNPENLLAENIKDNFLVDRV